MRGKQFSQFIISDPDNEIFEPLRPFFEREACPAQPTVSVPSTTYPPPTVTDNYSSDAQSSSDTYEDGFESDSEDPYSGSDSDPSYSDSTASYSGSDLSGSSGNSFRSETFRQGFIKIKK